MQSPVDRSERDLYASVKWVVLACVILLTGLAPTRVAAVTAAVLIDTDLEPHKVNIHGLVDGVISYFDADRHLQVKPMSQFVQVRIVKNLSDTPRADIPEATHPPNHDGQSIGMIELVDGQRFVGRWIGVDEQSQALIWRHPSLGRLKIPLDRLHVLGQSSVLARQEVAQMTDEVELINNDRITGYVIGVNAIGVEFQLEEGGRALEIAFDQVRTLRLANPVVHRPADHSMVWLSDGSRVLAKLIKIATDRIEIGASLITHTDTVSLSMSQVDRIDWASTGGYLVDLADLPWRVLDEGSVFGLTVKPRIEGTTILLHAPTKVIYTLPPGTERFWALAQTVDGSESERAIAWMDFEVIITVDGKTSCREHLYTDRRSAVLNVVASGQTMTIELAPAMNGPIMDRLSLRDAVVFVRPHMDEDAGR